MLRLNLSRLRWRAFAAWAARSDKVRRALPHVKVLLGAEAGFEVAPVKDVLLAWARRQLAPARLKEPWRSCSPLMHF